jgi:DNA-binding XRE family transcriptional regulator
MEHECINCYTPVKSKVFDDERLQPDPHIDRLVCATIDILREKRESLGVSKKRLAEDSGVTRTAIILMERHERSPSLELLLRLSMALQIPFSEVIAEADKRCSRKKR